MSSASNSPFTSPKENLDSNPFTLDDLLNKYETTGDDEGSDADHRGGSADGDIPPSEKDTSIQEDNIDENAVGNDDEVVSSGVKEDGDEDTNNYRSPSSSSLDSSHIVIPTGNNFPPPSDDDDYNSQRSDERRSRHDSNDNIDENRDSTNSSVDIHDLPSFSKISRPGDDQLEPTDEYNNENTYDSPNNKNPFAHLSKSKISFDGEDENNPNYHYDNTDTNSEYNKINVTGNCQIFESSPINIFDSDINNFYYKRQYKPKDLIVFPKSPPKPKTIQTESRKPLLSNIQSFDDLFNFYEPELRQLFIFYGYNHRGNIKKDTMDKTINLAEVIKCIKDLHIYTPCTQLNKAAVDKLFMCVANPNNKQELNFHQFGHLFVRLCGISICRPPFTNRFRNPYDLCCIVLFLLELDNKKYLKSRLRGFDEFTKAKIENIDDCVMNKRINLLEYNSVLPTNQWIDVQSLFGTFNSPLPEIPLLKSKEPVFIPQLFLIPVNIISQPYADNNLYNGQNSMFQPPGIGANIPNMNHNVTFVGQTSQPNNSYKPGIGQNYPPSQSQFPNTFARQGNQIASSFIPPNMPPINNQNNIAINQGHNVIAPSLAHNLPQNNFLPGQNINSTQFSNPTNILNSNQNPGNPYGLPPNQPILPPYNPMPISQQPNNPRPPPRFNSNMPGNSAVPNLPQYVGNSSVQNYGGMTNSNMMYQNKQPNMNQYLPPTNTQNMSNNLIPSHLNRNVLKEQSHVNSKPQKKKFS